MVDTAPIRAFLDDQHIALAERVSDFATGQLAPLAEPPDDATARRDEKIVFYVGRLVWEKGLQVLADAAPQIVSIYPNVKFVVADKKGVIRDYYAATNDDAVTHVAAVINELLREN